MPPTTLKFPFSTGKGYRVQHFRKWRTLFTRSNLLAFFLIGICLALFGGLHQFNINLFTKAGLQETISSLGIWGPLLYISVLALSVVVSQIPGVPMACAAGAVWGIWLGGVYSVVGGFIGAMVAYYLGRTLGRSSIQALTGKTLYFTTLKGHFFLGWVVFISRLLPIVSFDVVSYGAGMAGLSLPLYAVATLFGMIPSTLLITYLGESMLVSTPLAVVFWGVFLLVLVGLPWGIRRHNWLGLRDVIRVD